jgi:hypothetical protein
MVMLSKHTSDEMEGGGILLSYIEAALTSPDRVVQDMTDPALSRSHKVIPEFGNRRASRGSRMVTRSASR